ncbi:Lsr2 family DNA-binding protein [Micromonospora pisi]|uniref:Lsr2 family DNA-binding protein n=1 Tax=Micromonospora pisi TaxID=589240 RepID=UPI000EAF92FF|nr:histone-like nucleoid-structuring protein Lsr2 [Micromonospora pisi]
MPPRPHGRRGTAPQRAGRDLNKAIRQWSFKNGHDVSKRGRIPASGVGVYRSP